MPYRSHIAILFCEGEVLVLIRSQFMSSLFVHELMNQYTTSTHLYVPDLPVYLGQL